MAARKVEYDEGLKALRVNGRPFPLVVLETLADLPEGDSAVVTRNTATWTCTVKRTPTEVPPTPRYEGDGGEKKERPITTKKLKVVWPPEKANAPFPEKLKLDGKLPNEPLDSDVGPIGTGG